jgi:hypothetical protein
LPQHLKLQIWESLSTRLYDLYDLSQNWTTNEWFWTKSRLSLDTDSAVVWF